MKGFYLMYYSYKIIDPIKLFLENFDFLKNVKKTRWNTAKFIVAINRTFN